jgi:MFS family permease
VIRRPTLVLALLTALNLLNFIDRYVLAAVLPKVRDTLHLSNFVSGLMATVFLAGYFLTSPIFGVLGDRMRRTWLITFGIVVWSIATFASGLAQGATSMLVCRALVGVGEASFTAIAPTLIDDVTPKDKKGKYLAIFYVAQPIGAALGYLLGGALEKAYGWRAAFYFAGGPGLVLALTCLLIAEPDRGVREKADVRKAFGELWASRQYRRAILGYCAYTFAIGGFSYWAPTFLSDTFHIDLAKANFRFGLLTVVGGAIGTFVGGSFADRMQKRAVDRAALRGSTEAHDAHAAHVTRVEIGALLKLCAIGSLVGAPLAAACFLSPSANGFFASALFCETALFLSTSPINAIILKSVPSHLRASAMALAIFSIHLFGDLWSPPLVGVLSDHMPPRLAMLTLAVAIGLSGYLWWPRRAEIDEGPAASKGTEPTSVGS